jgi:hypothetical protein
MKCAAKRAVHETLPALPATLSRPSDVSMQSLSLHETEHGRPLANLELEISELETLLEQRRAELVALQEEFREFKSSYTEVVGSRLAELTEVERSIKDAEARLFNLETDEEEDEDDAAEHNEKPSLQASGKTALRKLFWSVARLFHPDHAADETEAKRRHEIMAEASRAYQAGDVESLNTMLGDEQLQFFCTAQGAAEEGEEDLTNRLLRLKAELSTIEFGIRRIRQDGLYRLKLKTDDEARQGRDALSSMAESINRQITKARHRLEHLSS